MLIRVPRFSSGIEMNKLVDRDKDIDKELCNDPEPHISTIHKAIEKNS